MNPARVAVLVASALLSSCSSASPPPAAPQDASMQRNSEAGHLAFGLDRPAEAAAQYQQALKRAQARDDAAAIGDYGYDLAVAELSGNQPKEALASARMTKTELSRRGIAPFPALILVEATALYRLGDKQQADHLAAMVEAGGDQTAAAGASFLRGLIADETGNGAELDAAIARLAHPTTSGQSADSFELAARRDLRNGDYATAASEAQRAVALRRTNLDYRGMARALAVEGAAEAGGGNTTTAADLYIRAAQSAAAQGDADAARPWLHRALALANTPAQRQLAQQTLAQLTTGPTAPGQH